VAGIWGVAIGLMRIVIAFEIKRLPRDIDEAWGSQTNRLPTAAATTDRTRAAAAGS
jgi:hypothetical protein